MPTPHRLATRPHQAVLAAAADPDHQVPNTFNARTHLVLVNEGLAHMRPFIVGDRTYQYDELFGPPDIHLTAAGRAYAERHGVETPRRRIVVISCGSLKFDPGVNEFGRPNALPAGDLYQGPYHRSLRAAADALTTGRRRPVIVSALHGLVELDRSLLYYDVRLGDAKAVSAATIRAQAQRLDLDDAEVIVLGGRAYVELVTGAVPHALAPLTGGLGAHRAQCRAVHENGDLAASWWTEAARLFDQHQPGRTTEPLQPQIPGLGPEQKANTRPRACQPPASVRHRHGPSETGASVPSMVRSTPIPWTAPPPSTAPGHRSVPRH
ncbi:DUF6884 domain-containing protein [Kitasatospora griseola]|uniref:DUF6884 domain-containing protein n=1 Tax=Kitasatospora griseola TaxID=2064 RepID=UPI003855F864